MRVLLSTYGTRGDVEPLVALAVRLRALGATVRMCAPPDEEFAKRLAGVAVELVPVGPPVKELMRGRTLPSDTDLARYRNELIETQFDTFPAAFEGCDVVVAAGLAQVAARSVAETAGIPYVYVSYAAVHLPSPHHAPPPRPGLPEPGAAGNRALWESDTRTVNALFGEALNRRRAALGLPLVHNVRDHILTDRPWLAADTVLGPWLKTPGLDVVETGAWTLADERPLPADLTRFLDAGSPPVYVGFGSMSPREGIGGMTVEAIRAQGYRVLVSRGWAGLDLVDDGDDCLTIGEVNHRHLFGRVAAVVHHGGAGTTLTAARAGTPQVVIPLQLSDNPYWAGQVAALGLGAALDAPTTTVESLGIALKTALSPETRARANSLGSRLRTDGAEVTARRLVDEAW